MSAVGRGVLRGEVSVSLLQEYVHVRGRRTGDRAPALAEAAQIARAFAVHAFEPSDAALMLRLLEVAPRLDPQDAVYAATAFNRGLDTILATDRDFDDVAGLERVDPLDAERVEALMGS